MGIPLFKPSGSSNSLPPQPIVFPQNPNPMNFKVMKMKWVGKFAILMIHYPDCLNYEGKKILVYKNLTMKQLAVQTAIDPHFCNNKKVKSPIARFVPTNAGWKMAIKLCEVLQ